MNTVEMATEALGFLEDSAECFDNGCSIKGLRGMYPEALIVELQKIADGSPATAGVPLKISWKHTSHCAAVRYAQDADYRDWLAG